MLKIFSSKRREKDDIDIEKELERQRVLAKEYEEEHRRKIEERRKEQEEYDKLNKIRQLEYE